MEWQSLSEGTEKEGNYEADCNNIEAQQCSWRLGNRLDMQSILLLMVQHCDTPGASGEKVDCG